MAYLPQQPLEEEEQPQPTGAGGSTIIGGGPPQTPAMGGTQPSTPQGSGSWTNLQRYLDVNQPQATQMAQKIGTGFQQQRGEIGERIKQEGEQYQAGLAPVQQKAEQERAFAASLMPQTDYSQVDYSALPYRIDTRDPQTGDYTRDTSYADRIGELQSKLERYQTTDPKDLYPFVWRKEDADYWEQKKADDIAKIQNLVSGLQYQGSVRSTPTPTEAQMDQFGRGELFMPERAIDPFQTGQQSALEAYRQRLAQTRTEPGRIGELERLYGGEVTKGESLLNQLLLQGNPYARQMWGEQQQQFESPTGLPAQLEATTTEAQAQQRALEDLRAQNLAQAPELQQLAGDIQSRLVDPMTQSWQNIMGGQQYGVVLDLHSGWVDLKNQYKAEGYSDREAGELAAQNMPSVKDFMMSKARYTPLLGADVPGYDLGEGYTPGMTNTEALDFFKQRARDLHEQTPVSPETTRVAALQKLLEGYNPEFQGTV